MANRIMLNETSYFGKGAIQEIAGEIKSRGCRKVMVCTDPDLPAFEQFDGVGQMNLTQAVEIDQGENRQEKEQRTLKGGEGEFKAQGNSAVEQAEQQEVH